MRRCFAIVSSANIWFTSETPGGLGTDLAILSDATSGYIPPTTAAGAGTPLPCWPGVGERGVGGTAGAGGTMCFTCPTHASSSTSTEAFCLKLYAIRAFNTSVKATKPPSCTTSFRLTHVRIAI